MKVYRYMLQLSLALLVGRGYVACSDVDFEQAPQASLCTEDRNDCVVNEADQTAVINGSFRVEGQAEVLFVIDNSPSMSPEQQEIAQRFPGFLDELDVLGDYRIAFTTTDMSQTANWPTRGGLLTLPGGGKFIDRNTSEAVALFQDAVQRRETQECENQPGSAGSVMNGSFRPNVAEVNPNCPSMDEQGIAASKYAIERRDPDFFRDYGHLAIIVISDEDERSFGTNLGPDNQPQELIKSFEGHFPSATSGLNRPDEHKTLAFHSIIIPPGDAGCLSTQGAQIGMSEPTPGATYAALSQMTNGIIGSVCAENYTQILKDIGKNVSRKAASFQIDCELDSEDLLVNTADPNMTYTIKGRTVTFDQPLPVGTEVTYSYTCPLYSM